MDETLLFLSYAHEDDKLKKGFVDAINPALKGKNWRLWQDGEIMPGANWDDHIRKNLAEADVIILLVSTDFLNSEQVLEIELKASLERHKNGTALVIPVILDGCLWEETELQGIQPVMINEKIKKDPKGALQDAARKVLDSVKAYKPGAGKASVALKPEEINELRQLGPEAIVVAVRNKKDLFLLQPKSGDISQHQLSATGLPQKVLAILQRLLLKGDLEEDDCRVLGEALFSRLFADAAAQNAFIRAYQNNLPADGKPLKIVLHFDDASNDLAGLPWEYLWLPLPEGTQEGFFIGEKENLVLTRRLSAAGKEKKVEADKLRILVAYSRPQILEIAKRIEDDASSVFNRSQPRREEDKKLWENIKIVGPQEFTSKMAFEEFIKKENPFHIVHFVGKGKTEQGTSLIAFCDPAAKKEEWLTAEAFVKCFPDDKKPNLILLHPPPDSCRSLRDLALNLVTLVDGVLAIQTPVKSEEAADFSEKLYTALASGEYLDEAVAHAARFAATKSANRLRMYGISASFSRATLKMEVAKPAVPVLSGNENFVFMECPNLAEPAILCKQLLPVKGGRVVWTFCKKCDAGPLWFCPNCQKAVVNLSEKRCLHCGYETAKMVVPDEIRQLIPTPAAQPAKPAGPGTMTDRSGHTPQESRRAEPGAPK
ncbi:MAG: hypothetical protein OHK0019_11510 [Saprospiraceae bacterium]